MADKEPVVLTCLYRRVLAALLHTKFVTTEYIMESVGVSTGRAAKFLDRMKNDGSVRETEDGNLSVSRTALETKTFPRYLGLKNKGAERPNSMTTLFSVPEDKSDPEIQVISHTINTNRASNTNNMRNTTNFNNTNNTNTTRASNTINMTNTTNFNDTNTINTSKSSNFEVDPETKPNIKSLNELFAKPFHVPPTVSTSFPKFPIAPLHQSTPAKPQQADQPSMLSPIAHSSYLQTPQNTKYGNQGDFESKFQEQRKFLSPHSAKKKSILYIMRQQHKKRDRIIQTEKRKVILMIKKLQP